MLADGTNLGAFSGAVGQYSFSLTWSTLPASALTFGPGGTALQLKAVFYDHASHEGSLTLSLPVSCSQPLDSACSGTCADLSTDTANCGECGRPVPAGGVCQGGVPMCTGSMVACANGCVDLDTSITDCNACGVDCKSWAAARGLPSDAYLTCAAGTGCQTAVTAWTLATCDSICAGKGLTCLNQKSCSIDYSPYYTPSTYGGCVSFETSTNGCLNELGIACDALPPATEQNCDYAGTWNYWYQDCLCH
jgi:hypothetical protein